MDLKPLYYTKIDYNRMPRAYDSIKNRLKIPKIIHIVGTNGKGTTGRFIANALFALNKSVGHYSSPHISKFNERIWLNGKDVDDETLENAHQRLIEILDKKFQESLSYFEYTTLLAMMVYQECDFVILEAGLGGEHDATNVFGKVLSVVTPIGMDHEDFLGHTIEEIALTKLKSVDKKAIVSKQLFSEVFSVCDSLKNDTLVEFVYYEDLLNPSLITLAQELCESEQLPQYLNENLLLAMSAIVELGFKIDKRLFKAERLEGRMQKIMPNVYVDVGHNTLAAKAIVSSFRNKKINLVYNSYKDKEYLSILAILKPIIKEVEIIEIEDERMVESDTLVAAIKIHNMNYKIFKSIVPDESYLVFGSFKVVEEFKKFC